LGRLVPFSVFVIVPFAELLLPIALKLFPNLLPSTYEGQKTRDAKATNLRATRKEVSSFLRNTLQESGLPLSAANAQKEEFVNFFKKVCSDPMGKNDGLGLTIARSVPLASLLLVKTSSRFAVLSRTILRWTISPDPSWSVSAAT
jgi:hypothetical protein